MRLRVGIMAAPPHARIAPHLTEHVSPRGCVPRKRRCRSFRLRDWGYGGFDQSVQPKIIDFLSPSGRAVKTNPAGRREAARILFMLHQGCGPPSAARWVNRTWRRTPAICP